MLSNLSQHHSEAIKTGETSLKLNENKVLNNNVKSSDGLLENGKKKSLNSNLNDNICEINKNNNNISFSNSIIQKDKIIPSPLKQNPNNSQLIQQQQDNSKLVVQSKNNSDIHIKKNHESSEIDQVPINLSNNKNNYISKNNEKINKLSKNLNDNFENPIIPSSVDSNLKFFEEYLYEVFPYPVEINYEKSSFINQNNNNNNLNSNMKIVNDSENGIIKNILFSSNFYVDDKVSSFIKNNMTVKEKKNDTIDLTYITETSDLSDFNDFTAPSALDALAALTVPEKNKKFSSDVVVTDSINSSSSNENSSSISIITIDSTKYMETSKDNQ
eukprot:jgi/Orpsp1_1/1174091/evm.model.c7180000048865.1